jgi:hypothetical protein
MKITVSQHLLYLQTTFDLDTELPKIIDWMDKEWRSIYLPWLENKSQNKYSEDEIRWKWLITMFDKLPDGKKTKAFVYQLMVLNDLANDGTNVKAHCWRRNKDCVIVQRLLERMGRDWKESDMQNICGNMGVCLRLPDTKMFPFSLELPENLTVITIDDRILNIKK